jgi:hypothetical protein
MGHRIAAVIIVAGLTLAAVAQAPAQGQLPRPGQLPPAGGQPQQRAQPAQRQQPQQPAQPAAKPYKPVAIAAPEEVKDQSLRTFRNQLAAIAGRKDRRALAGLVAQNFFWLGEKGDKADKKRPGIDNLAKAIGLDAKDGSGWDVLAGYSADPTGTNYPDRKDTICSPASPKYNEQQFEALTKATGTEESDWGYPLEAGLEMRASAQPNAPAVEKLSMHLVWVLPDSGPANEQNPTLRVVAPSGKTGFVPTDAISPLGGDEICYGKEGGGWKIVGFIGGE